MKNLSLILNIVLFVLVLLLYIDRFANNKKGSNNDSELISTNGAEPNQIVYVNLDTLLDNYSLYNELMVDYYAKQQLLESQMQTKYYALERKSAELQQKFNDKLITTATAQTQQEELYLEQQQLTVWQQEKSTELAEDEAGINQRVYDSIQSIIKYYNKDNRHKLIISNTYGGVLLQGDKSLNITDTLVSMINLQYTKFKKDTTSTK